MSTVTASRTDTSPSPAGTGDARSTRLSRWRASWRIALRMARRDVRRHKGRSALVFVMVSLPVTLIVATACFGATEQTSPVDLVPARMGPGQALVQGPAGGPVTQSPDARNTGSTDATATPIPGYTEGADNAAALAALLKGTVVATSETEARFVQGDRRIRTTGLVLGDLSRDLAPKAVLLSGRWPANSEEVAVTAAGTAKGMPSKGTITMSSQGTDHTVTVVGTAKGLTQWSSLPDYLTTAPLAPTSGADAYGSAQWILLRDTPVTWSEVLALNRYGLTVESASVLRDPPPDSEVPQDVRASQSFAQDTSRQVAILGAVMLFIITTLLVGPAFAVSASRSRRTLALAASNGAETRQLRRTVLAQALVLGVLAALGGCVVGGVGIWAALRVYSSANPGWSGATLAFDIPWTAMAILVPCAVLSAVVAALLPALRLGRLDIVGVMRGQSVSPRLNRILPVLGLLVAVGGGVWLVTVAASGGREFAVAVAAIALVLGTLLVIPALLVGFGRLASRLPVAARMATRDAARHRARATPTVAAILAAVAALTAFSIGLASDTKQRMAEYVPQALAGEGFVSTYDAEARIAVDAALSTEAPGLVRVPLMMARSADDPYAAGPAAPRPAGFVAALPRGCALGTTLSPVDQQSESCNVLGSQAYNSGQVGVLPTAEIVRRLGLDAEQGKVIADGGIAVAVPAFSTQPTLEMVSGTLTPDPQTGAISDIKVVRTTTMPVVAVPAQARTTGVLPESSGALVSTDTAQRLGWPLAQDLVLLRDPNGAIDPAVQKRIDERVGDTVAVYVERGFQRDDKIVMEIMFGAAALLILIVTLISTALSLAEQQADMGTFAAVGATRRTRRGLAAAQAMVVGFLGSVLGIAVGLAPGIAVAYPLTAQSYDPLTGAGRTVDPTLVVPWLPLTLVVVGVPLLAGLLSAAAIRRAPAMTRRAD